MSVVGALASVGGRLQAFEDKVFLWLVLAASIAFAWVVWPFAGAILWGTVLAIVFAPLQRRLVRLLRHRRSLAALITLLIVVVMVILPLAAIGASLLDQAARVYRRIQSGQLDLGRYFEDIIRSLPPWASRLLARFDLTDFGAVLEAISRALRRGSQFFAAQAIAVGQNTFAFVVELFVALYLLFFLLRDGDTLAARIKMSLPLRVDQQRALFEKFALVVRATIKGSVVVAVLQGALGGLIFAMLGIDAALFWGVLMAVLSLLPAVGPALVWIPVALAFLATGAVWQGLVLIAWGVLVIGLVDNVVRPILVGKDTKIPDYVVLIATLGGIAVVGINGFVVGPLVAAMFMAVWDIFSSAPDARRSGRRSPRAS